MGRSILHGLLTQLEDAKWCSANDEELRDLSKPATIIDGQHRVKGAEACERDIPFTVCAIVDCLWDEQVFQFTVINYTQKGIPDQFITANAALSLTEVELEELRVRLDQAGVKVIEYELMRVVNFDQRSPFNDLVNLTEKAQDGKIGYKTMVQVAKGWYNGRAEFFQLLLPSLYPEITGKGRRAARLARWKEGDWADFFIDFWQIIRTYYGDKDSHVDGATLWSVGDSQLTIAAVLASLQEAFFDNLNAQDEEFFEVEGPTDPATVLRRKFRNRAEKFVEWIPPDFFATQWGVKSLNTGPGRLALRTAMENLVKTKGKYQYGKSALVSGDLG